MKVFLISKRANQIFKKVPFPTVFLTKKTDEIAYFINCPKKASNNLVKNVFFTFLDSINATIITKQKMVMI